MPRSRLIAHAVFLGSFFLVLLITHFSVLDLPYFWDEMGQFVPAALDIYQHGAWIPQSTTPNVHPPGVMAYLALVWKLAGYSVVATRVAMLLFAAVGVWALFLLAMELFGDLPGAPALIPPLLLLASPLFWAQSMMAQLDMPAMVLTVVALLLFLRARYAACAVACTVLVLLKESSIAVPAVFGAWLLVERRWKAAVLFFLPAAALAIWLGCLRAATGHLLGNQEFTHYNITFQLHPVRLPVTLIRRFFYLFIDNFHVIGTVAVVAAWRRTRIFRSRAWAIVATVALVQTLVVSVLGGAALERYLMPVIPLVYLAFAAAFNTFRPRARNLLASVTAAGLIFGMFFNAPFTYPYENNSAFVTFVRLQQTAAEFVAARFPRRTVASAWPFPDALRRPEFGYIEAPMQVRGLANFDPETVLKMGDPADVLVLYSRTWEPGWGVLRSPWIRDFLTEYYFYKPQISAEQVQDALGLRQIARWESRGQWIEVYAVDR